MFIDYLLDGILRCHEVDSTIYTYIFNCGESETSMWGFFKMSGLSYAVGGPYAFELNYSVLFLLYPVFSRKYL